VVVEDRKWNEAGLLRDERCWTKTVIVQLLVCLLYHQCYIIISIYIHKYFLYTQTGTGAHPASCPVGTGCPFPGAKARMGRDTDHSPPPSAEVKNE
jgi:hypothetical protein